MLRPVWITSNFYGLNKSSRSKFLQIVLAAKNHLLTFIYFSFLVFQLSQQNCRLSVIILQRRTHERLVLLRLSKSAPKPRFYSNIEPYRNRGSRLCIDGFGFSVSIKEAALMSWLCSDRC